MHHKLVIGMEMGLDDFRKLEWISQNITEIKDKKDIYQILISRKGKWIYKHLAVKLNFGCYQKKTSLKFILPIYQYMICTVAPACVFDLVILGTLVRRYLTHCSSYQISNIYHSSSLA